MLHKDKMNNKESFDIDNVELFSFDIFDTLISRRVILPNGIFKIIEKILNTNIKYKNLSKFLKTNFFSLRISAEETAKKRKIKEVNIYEIYDVIKDACVLNDETVGELIKLELSVEKNNIIPIDKNIHLIKQLILQKKKVILISDMYLTSSQIRDILTNIDSVFTNIEIISSCDINCTKKDKTTYKYIARKHNIAYEKWLHYGDNVESDINNAKELGIKVVHLQKEYLLPFEKKLLHFHNTVETQGSLAATRICKTINNNLNDTYLLGCSFAAPLLYRYVSYIIENAVKKKIEVIYFLSRDGYILKEIADVIICQKKINITTKYLYGSRKAFRVPLKNNIESFIKKIKDEYKENNDISYIKEYFPFLSDFDEIEKNINKNEILNYYEPKLKNLKKYINQEIDFKQKIAFVDLCGTGYSQDLLQNIIKTCCHECNIETFYFYNSPNMSNESKKYSYYIASKGCMLWLELLCRANHGQVIGYQENINSKIMEPIFENYDPHILDKWGWHCYVQGICDYSIEMSKFETINKIEVSSYDLFNLYFNTLLKHESPFLAELLGSIPFSSIGPEFGQEAAPPYTYKEAFEYKIHDKLNFIRYARTSVKIQKIINYRKYHSFFMTILYFLFRHIFSLHIVHNKKIMYFFGFKITINRGN